jgi:hypothetical protein
MHYTTSKDTIMRSMDGNSTEITRRDFADISYEASTLLSTSYQKCVEHICPRLISFEMLDKVLGRNFDELLLPAISTTHSPGRHQDFSSFGVTVSANCGSR